MDDNFIRYINRNNNLATSKNRGNTSRPPLKKAYGESIEFSVSGAASKRRSGKSLASSSKQLKNTFEKKYQELLHHLQSYEQKQQCWNQQKTQLMKSLEDTKTVNNLLVQRNRRLQELLDSKDHMFYEMRSQNHQQIIIIQNLQKQIRNASMMTPELSLHQNCQNILSDTFSTNLLDKQVDKVIEDDVITRLHNKIAGELSKYVEIKLMYEINKKKLDLREKQVQSLRKELIRLERDTLLNINNDI